jgi:membrane-associated phospholipid phosphatase
VPSSQTYASLPYVRAAVIVAIALPLFIVIAHNVAMGGAMVPVDLRLAAWFHAHARPGLTQAMLLLTHAHDPIAIDAWSALIALVLARRREWHWLIGLVLAAPGGLLINGIIKRVFERARPTFDDPLLTLSTFSFPSGHAAGTTLLYGMVAAYMLSRTREPMLRAVIIALCVTMVACVAFSRVYLGVHYLSDVLGGIAWSLVWLTLCRVGVMRLQQRRAARQG